jgi:hypothetical protein
LQIIDTLENKVEKLILKIKRLDQNKPIELTKSAYIIQTQSNDIEALKSKYETLKIANPTRQ